MCVQSTDSKLFFIPYIIMMGLWCAFIKVHWFYVTADLPAPKSEKEKKLEVAGLKKTLE